MFVKKSLFGLAVVSDAWKAGFTMEPEVGGTDQYFYFYNEVMKLLPVTLFPGYRKANERSSVWKTLKLLFTGILYKNSSPYLTWAL